MAANTVDTARSIDQTQSLDEAVDAQADLLFVGAGIASTYTLLALLERLGERTGASRPLAVTVIERSDDVFKGLAYGDRSGVTSLLITTLKDFLAPAERELFVRWLEANEAWAFDEFRSAGGPLVEQWWARNGAAVASRKWDDVYLPRHLFGRFMRYRAETAIARAEQDGTAVVTRVVSEVSAIERGDGGYDVVGDNGDRWQTHALVLGLGSPPSGAVAGPTDTAPNGLLHIDDPYQPALAASVAAVARHLDAVPQGTPRVLVVGGNASAMEMLWVLADSALKGLVGADLVMVNPSGSLPETLTDPNPANSFATTHLDALDGDGPLSGADIHHAALADIEIGRTSGVPVGDMLAPIGAGIGRLVPRLSECEASRFASHWGLEIGRQQRRSGVEYTAAAAALRGSGRLDLLAGSFVGTVQADGGGAHVKIRTADGQVRVDERRFDAVVNCRGALPIDQPGRGNLAAQLIASGLCNPTPLGRGIAVNDDFEASDGLYVIGPMLAGNVLRGQPLWHMEHCGRVNTYANLVAEQLVARPGPR